MLDDICTHDFEYWKVAKVVPDEEDYAEVELVIRAYMHKLKNIFNSMACMSKFPQVGLQDFTAFCNHKFLMVDKKYLNDAAVDLACVGAMTNDVKFNKDVQVAGAITRFEFLEILVRCAKAKYLVPGIVDNYADAVEKLLEDCIIKNYKEEEWDSFRMNRLWNLECSDLFLANLDGIKKVMAHYHEPRRMTFSRENAYELLVKESGLECPLTEITYCWGMSKMTVV